MVKRILVVEDDLSLKPLWESFFSRRKQEIQMEWVVSCEEARKIVKKSNSEGTPFFLIITDIFLAGSGTGMELLQSPEVASSHAKTVLVSAADRHEILSKFGHLMPNTEVISKPLDFRKYEPILNHLLAG